MVLFILCNLLVYSLFHSAGFVFHTVKYVSHTVVFYIPQCETENLSRNSSLYKGVWKKLLLHLSLYSCPRTAARFQAKRQKMDKGMFFCNLRQIEKMHTMELKSNTSLAEFLV